MSTPLLTGKQICNMWSITRWTLARWVQAGLLPPPLRMGRVRRWRQEDVDAAMQAAAARN